MTDTWLFSQDARTAVRWSDVVRVEVAEFRGGDWHVRAFVPLGHPVTVAGPYETRGEAQDGLVEVLMQAGDGVRAVHTERATT